MTTSNPNGPEPVVGPDNEQLDREVNEALGGQSVEELMRDPAALAGAAGSAAEAAGAAAAAAGEHDDPAAAHISMELVRGRIGAVRGDDVFVELTGFGKNQGIVPLTQFDRPPRLGSIMDFVVQRLDEAEGLVILSREGAVTKATWEQLTRGAAVEARVMGHNKGGLELEMVGGIRAFMPASQVDLHHVADLEALHGQKLQALVQEIDRRSRKVVLSRRAFLEAERHARQAKLWQELHIGDTREGKVTSLAEYGAFVDIGGVDGLIHVSDLSYSRVDRPSDMLKVGDQIRVKILKLDAEKKRIGLGLKQVAPDPWDSVESQFRAGDQVSGRVTRVADFGAFVELLAGVEGLLPISEMSWKRINKPSDLVKEGDVLRVKLLALDVAKRRMTLSLKQASGDPWVGATVKYARHAVVEGTVLSTPEFGAFVELEAGIEGLVHISELADRRVNAVTDVVKPGDKVQCRVLEVDEDNRRIRLSIKQAREPATPPPAEAPAAGATPGKPAAAKPKPRKLSGPGAGGLGHSAALGMGLGQLKL